MSPQISRGINIPVEFFAPKDSANPVTIIAAIPLIPAFEIPNKSAQAAAMI